MAYRRIPPNDKIVHPDGKGYWWFWNEDWNKRIGPYDTEEEAHAALEVYIDQWDPKEYVRRIKEDPEYATRNDID